MPARAPRSDDLLLRPREVALELGVRTITVRRWIARGWLPAVELPGGGYRIARHDLQRAMRQQRSEGERPSTV